MKQVVKVAALAALALSSCRSSSYKKDPVGYSENADNGLVTEVKRSGIIYKIQYRPSLFVLRKEGTEESSEAYKQRKEALRGMAWFNITLRAEGSSQSVLRHNVSSLDEYVQRQDYYLNQAQKDLKLEYAGKTMYPVSYWFENNQNLTSHETIVVGFELPKGVESPEEDLTISFQDRVFENGIIKAIIKKDDLEVVSGL